MDIFNLRETHGRRLMVEFKCYRCGTRVLRSFDECLEESSECFRALYDCRPPSGWRNGGFYYPMFCPDCAAAYDEFMKGKKNDAQM